MSRATQVLHNISELSSLFENKYPLAEFVSFVLDVLKDEPAVAVAGGIAVSLYSRPRATQDLDLVVLSSDITRLETTLLGSGFEKVGIYDFEKPPKKKIHKYRFRDRELDLLSYDDHVFAKFLIDSSHTTHIGGVAIRALSPDGVVLTKLASGRGKNNIGKDFVDIQNIVDHKTSIDWDVIKQWSQHLRIFDRYGDLESFLDDKTEEKR